MSPTELIAVSLAQHREAILREHDLIATRELLSTWDHLRFSIRCSLLEMEAWLILWPFGLSLLAFFTACALLVMNNLMEGNYAFVIAMVALALATVYWTARVTDKNLRNRMARYNRRLQALKEFLMKSATDPLCMQRLIRLFSGLLERTDIGYSGNAAQPNPLPVRLPRIEEHKLLRFIFHDLPPQSRHAEQYFRDKNLFIGTQPEVRETAASECASKDTPEEPAPITKDDQLALLIPQKQRADIAAVKALLEMPMSEFDQLVNVYSRIVKQRSGLGPRVTRLRLVLAATGWIIKSARESGSDLRLLEAGGVPADLFSLFNDLKEQARQKWSLNDIDIEEITISKIQTFAAGQSPIVLELKKFKDALYI